MALAAIVGGTGRMGGWFADHLASNGYEVGIYDKNRQAARRLVKNRRKFRFLKDEAATEKSQLILLATPTRTTRELLPRIAYRTERRTLLVEISSVKEPVRRTIRTLARRGFPILSIHPLFGPGAKQLRGKTILVAHRPKGNRTAQNVLKTLRKRGARIIQCDLENHDRIVAATLALPHMMNLAFVETLRGTGYSPNRARELGGTTFRLQLLVAEALYHESLHNETSILADNTQCKRIFDSFIRQVKGIQSSISGGERGKLMRRFQNDAAYLRKDKAFRSAYDRFVTAVEAS